MTSNSQHLTCLILVETNTMYTQQQPSRSTTRNKFITDLQVTNIEQLLLSPKGFWHGYAVLQLGLLGFWSLSTI